MIGIVPVVSVIAWFATRDNRVFIMIPGALLFVGFPWLIALIVRIIIGGRTSRTP